MFSANTSKLNLPTRTRLLIIASVIIIYIAIFAPIYGLIGRVAIAFAIFPIVLSAILSGRWGGLAVSLLFIPINTILFLWVEESRLIDFLWVNFWAAHLIFILVGLIVGYMQELRHRLLFELEEHRRIKQDLHMSDKRYSLLVKNFPKSAIIVYDHELRFILVDGPETVRTGFTKDMMEGKSLYEALPPDYVQMFEPNMRAALEGQTFEVELPWEDEQYYRYTYVPLKNEDNQIVMAMILAQNITVEYQTLNKLKQSENHYRALFQQSNDAVFILQPDGTYLEVNAAAARMLGYRHDELMELSTPEITVPSEHEDSEDVRKKLFAGEQLPIYERTFRKKDGTEFPAEVNVELVRDEDGNPLHIQSIVRDISERKQTLDLLQKSEIRYRSLFQQSNDAVFIVDPNGNLLETNAAAAKMLGYTPDEMANVLIWEIVVPEAHSKMANVIERLVDGEKIPIYERNFRKKDGMEFPVEINVALIRDDAGNPLHIQSIARDVSERKHSQKQELMFALEVQKTQLLTKLIDDFSHDLRTPLSIIKTNLYLLDKLKEPEQQIEKLKVIELQVNHLEKVFQDILTISRLEGLGQPSFRLIKLGRLAREITAKFQRLAEQKSIHFDLQLDDHLPKVLGEKDTLFLAVNELVENALNYTENGGIVTIHTYTEDKYIVLKVEDTGCGISDEDMPRIFDYFFRGDNARSITTGGAGLGLCIAQKVAEVHGGIIDIESTLGEGSAFMFKLPYIDAMAND